MIGLATTGLKKSDVLPDLPTVAESVPGYEAVIWLGVMAPKGVPDAVIDTLNTTIARIVQQPDVAAAWRLQGADPLVMSPVKFKEFLDADIAKWARVVKLADVRPGQ